MSLTKYLSLSQLRLSVWSCQSIQLNHLYHLSLGGCLLDISFCSLNA